jgi:hypothetical protein
MYLDKVNVHGQRDVQIHKKCIWFYMPEITNKLEQNE